MLAVPQTPSPVPEGDPERAWVRVAASDELPAGGVLAAEAAAAPGATDEVLDLVVWRGHDGVACVMEARCPHQWSHLGAEGVVDGDEIVCAAHFWRFDRSGRGTKLNVRGRRDPKSDVAVYECRELGGVIEARLPG
jgi:phenylpropionate dioxygenase-like ring-hydroxylating dioxygenase large terminal subunit